MRNRIQKLFSLVLVAAMLLTALAGVVSAEEAGAVEIRGISAYCLESAYVEWTKDPAVSGYNVYVKADSASDWTQLDNMLIREYPGGLMRADALGLSAGSYTMKVVPLVDGAEQESAAAETNTIAVKAHDRSGYAHANGAVGAYNNDGTLKSNAVVVYVTEDTKNTVEATIGGVSYVGISNILDQAVLKRAATPICVRFIGNVTDLGAGKAFAGGDLLIDTQKNAFGLTLEGVGEDATINGFGIRIKNTSNMEVRNLGIMNVDSDEGDNLGLQQANDHIWVHNCDFFYGHAGGDADQAKGDGALDTKKSQYVTHSYNHFWDCGKCNLQGNGGDTSNYITYHHNWFDHSDSRHPRVREASVHVYNNYYDGNAKYGVGATCDADIFVEANYFRACYKPMMISKQGTDALGDGTFSGEIGGMIKAYGNVIEGASSYIPYSQDPVNFDAYEVDSRDEKIPSSVTTVAGGCSYNNFDTDPGFYSYKVQSAEDARDSVMAYAGRMNGGDFKWTFTPADDTDYGVNQAMKSALNSYTGKVVAIGGNSVSGGESGGGEEGGGEEGGDPGQLPTGTQIHDFTANGLNSSFYTIVGNLSDSKGTVSYDGKTLTQCLKIESKTSISFTAGSKGTLTLVFGSQKDPAAGLPIKIDGTNVNVGPDNILTIDLEAGAHTITKNKTMHLFYMVWTPDAPAHTHSYTSVVTPPTCTEKGYTTYTCSCGDSYVDDYVDAAGHSYTVRVTAPTCTEKGYTTYTCSCGDSYVDDYVDPAGHHHEVTETVPSTCVEKGHTAYACSCGDTYTEELPLAEHSYSGEFTVDVEATATTDGSKSRHCTTPGCTAKTDVTVIPALGEPEEPTTEPTEPETDIPATGDTTDPVMFTALSVFSLIALAGVMVIGKKNGLSR